MSKNSIIELAGRDTIIDPLTKLLRTGAVLRLKQVWAQEYQSWCDDHLDKDQWVYV